MLGFAIPFVRSADVVWRGGPGNSWHVAANWELPSDLPPGLTPAQAEGFRRVPTRTDRAQVPAGATVRVTAVARAQGIEAGGDIEVIGPGGSLELAHGTGVPPGDRFGGVVVGPGARLDLGNPAVVDGDVRVTGGQLSLFRPVDFRRKLRIEGLPVGEPVARLSGLDPAGPIVLGGEVELDGPTNSTVELSGRFLVAGGQMTWRNCFLDQFPGGLGTQGLLAFAESGGRRGILRLGGGGGLTVWRTSTESLISFGTGGVMIQGPQEQIFGARIEFLEGSLGVRAEGEQGLIRFESCEITMTGHLEKNAPGLVVDGPVAFSGRTVLTVRDPQPGGFFSSTVRFGTAGSSRHRVLLTDTAILRVDGNLDWAGGVVEGAALLEVRKAADQGRHGELSLARFSQGRMAFTGGTIRMPAGVELFVPEGYEWEFGKLGNTGTVAPRIVFEGNVVNRGRISVVGGTNRNARTRVDGLRVLENVETGELSCLTGHGFGSQALVVQGSSRPLRVLAAPGSPEVADWASPLGGVLMVGTDSGLDVEAGGRAQVTAGEVKEGATLNLRPGSTLRIAGRTEADTVTLPEGQVVTLGRLFNLRRGSTVKAEADARLEVDCEAFFGRNFRGGSFIDLPGGLGLERSLVIDHLVLGGLDGQTPQVRLLPGEFTDGIGVAVLKRLDWFGGAFVGLGSQTNPSTAAVFLPSGAVGALARPPGESQFGGNCSLGGGLTFEVFGSLSIDVVRAVTSEDAFSGFVFNSGSDVRIRQMGSQADNTTARVSNLTVVRKEGPDAVFFNGRWVNEAGGELRVLEGEFVMRLATLEGGGFQTSDTGSTIRMDEATIRDFAHAGSAIIVGRPLRFEGNCAVDSLTVGNGVSGEVVLQSAADSVLTVRRAVTWRSNGIRLGENARLVTAPGSFTRIASTRSVTPAGLFEAGTWENHGEVEVVGNTVSRFLFLNAGVFENHGTVKLDSSGGGQFFDGRGNGDPDGFRFINRGLLLLAALANRQVNVLFGGEYVSPGSGRLEVEGQAPLGGGSIGPRRRAGPAAPNPPNVGVIVFRDLVEISDGVMDLRTVDATFRGTVRMTGGRIIGGGNGDVRFDGSYQFNGGELRLVRPAFGRFGRVVTLRQARLHLDADTELDALPGFNLRDGSVLSGMGRTSGGVTVIGSRVEPGDVTVAGEVSEIGRLQIGADITFDAASRLVLHVPVQKGVTLADGLVVAGKATLAGTLEFVPVNITAAELLDAVVPVLDFGTREGDFTAEQSPIVRDDLRLTRRFRDLPPETDMVAALVAEGIGRVAADLALESEAPLTSPVGVSVPYRFVAINRGPDEAPAAFVDVTLPAGVEVESVEPAGTQAGNRMRVLLGPVAKDERRPVVVKLKGTATPGALLVSAEVGSERPDRAPENNRISVTTAILAEGGFSAGRFALRPDGTLRLTVETLVGVRYRLERSTDLKAFTEVQSFVGDGGERVVDGMGSASVAPEFFRLLIVPAG